MVKQWHNDILNVDYIYFSSKNGNAVLTSDGVLIPHKQFKTMTLSEYNSVKNTNGGYNYNASRNMEKLVKKNYVPEEPPVRKTRPLFDVDEIIKEESKKEVVKDSLTTVENKPITPVEKPVVVENKPVEEIKPVEPVKIEPVKETLQPEVKEPIQPVIEKKQVFNAFDFFYPKIMLCLAVICSFLSIYFTATYLQRLQDTLIAYAISTSMLLFGVIGFQMAKKELKKKRKFQFIVYLVTSTLVIAFSMLSSIDVNYAKYKLNHKETEVEYNVNEGAKLSYDILKDELEDNKTQIKELNDDIKFQQTQYVLSWDNDLKKNVIIEGKITSTAQDKIKENNLRIIELQDRNKEINELLIQYAQGGVDMTKDESKTDRAKTLTDLLGSILGISGNVIQLIFLLVPSFFIDIINILSISIYCDKKDEENNL